ncbi:hypothetical protein ACLB2K_005952 [Fragaria x ananassa]
MMKENLCRLYELLRRHLDVEELQLRYVDWVDSVLKLHRAPTIERFRVSFGIGLRSFSSVDEWIRFAMKKGVQILELEFLDYHSCDCCYKLVPYVLCQNVLGIRKGSGLNPLSSNITSKHLDYVGYTSLKILDLKSVDVTGNVLEDILSNCPALERLSVSNSSKLLNLRVMSPSTAFKYLVIQRCHNLRRIQISDANLVSFVNEVDGLQSNKVDLHLKNLPLLVEVSLGGRRSLDFLEIYRRESVFPTLCNLKHLELPLDEDDDSALLQLSSFMKAAPLLHTLVLQVLGCCRLDIVIVGTNEQGLLRGKQKTRAPILKIKPSWLGFSITVINAGTKPPHPILSKPSLSWPGSPTTLDADSEPFLLGIKPSFGGKPY